MPNEWIETTIGAQVTLQRGIDITKATQREGTVPVVSSGGISSFHDTAAVCGPGVVLGRKGVVGSVYFVTDDFWPHDTTLWVKDFQGNDPRFVYYFFQWLAPRIAAMDVGSANPTLNRNHVHPLPIQWPTEVGEQRAIAHTLATLDDKIELNRRMGETLEALARALFKSWFVDFDPVRAKAEGRDPGLPQPIADLFPSRLVDSELGEIPEGWVVETLADHYEAVKGVSYKGSGLGDDGIPLHNLNSVHEGGGYKYEGIKYYTGEHAERHIVLAGDVIVANTEQGHDRLLIGYAALTPAFFGERGIASHHIYRLRPLPRSPLTAAYLCWLLNSPQMHDVVSGYANGTTVNMLPLDGVQKPVIAVPPRGLVVAFDSIGVHAARRHEELISVSQTLAALRDTLLPKLISGEVQFQSSQETRDHA